MAIRTKDELLGLITTRVGESPTDEDLSFLEDASDTLADLEASAKNASDWENKYKELDASWRKRYVNRFKVADGDAAMIQLETVQSPDDNYRPGPTTFVELFKEG